MSGRSMRIVCAMLAAAATVLASFSSTAVAQTSGAESFQGLLVVSNSAGERNVLASVVRASGVFDGVGRIVERENLPGDPDNVSRDDLVFAEGTLHIVNTNLEFSFDLDPRSCIGTFNVRQATVVDGGTGAFANASGTGDGSVTGTGLAVRNPDGSCASDQPPRSERDNVAATGTLSF